MARESYTDATTAEGHGEVVYSERERRGYSGAGEQVFLWIAWVLAFAVFAFFMQVDVGIMQAIQEGGPNSLMGGLDSGGASYFIIYVLGVIVLGMAIAYGAARWATRDRSRDPLTEAATRELYDAAARGDPPSSGTDLRSGEAEAYRRT